MNKTEARMVNTLIGWLTGHHADDDEAALSASCLAERVHMALGAGVRRETIAEVWNDPQRRPRLERGPVPGVVLDLLAACWDLESRTRYWPGADVVEVLDEWFTKQGINTAHPAARAKRGTEARVFEAWDTGAVAVFAALHATDQYAPSDVEGVHD